MRSKTFITALLGLSLCSGAFAAEAQTQEKPAPLELKPLTESEHNALIQTLSAQQQLSPEWLNTQLAHAKLDPSVIEKITTPWEAKPWYQYYPLFLTEKRIAQGQAFLKDNRELLQRAEQQFGVPAHYIAAILGVETYYGRIQGNHSVLNSLYTLGTRYPARGKFFTSELGHYLALSQQQEWPVESKLGSYAGAMGMAQFISSSYRAYAVDFDNDGHIDLFNSKADAIGSIANYFKQHGWQAGEPIVWATTVGEPQAISDLLNKKPKLNTTWGELAQRGVTVPAQISNDTPGLLFTLETHSGKTYWFGQQNYYTITRYNHSYLYAMTVHLLAEAIKP